MTIVTSIALTTSENQAVDKGINPILLAIAVCLALLALGAWQGDYGETLLNGTTL